MSRFSKVLAALVSAAVLLSFTAPAFSQRATGGGGAKAPGKKATVLYKQDFDDDGGLDNFKENAAWCDDPAGSFGSKGSLKISGDKADMGAERYMKWTDDETTIGFMFYAHGAKTGYLLAKAEKAGKNLHAYFPIKQQDQWQFARIKASSLVGFGGGNSSPGETFKNLVFVVEEWDKGVETPYLLIDKIVIFTGEDGTPPTAGPKGVSVKYFDKAKAASINWEAASDDVGVFVYEIHRSDTPSFEPTRKTRVARINDNYFEDKTVEAGKTYYYKIVAEDMGGYVANSDEVKYVSERAGAAPGKSSGDKPAGDGKEF